MTISFGSRPGVIRSTPLRIEYMNGDWERARRALAAANIDVMFQSVASVAPYTATIHVGRDDGERAIQALEDAEINWEKPTPYY